jgi:phosphomannomutase/phosphoglucomutase
MQGVSDLMTSSANVNPNIFRAYDIRGIVDEDLTDETVAVLGKGIGTYLVRQGANSIAIGRDNRLSSERFKNMLVEGVLSTGCDVIDIGLSTSPLLYAAVCMWDQGGGVNITGSHNPIEFNGFKITARNAYPVASEDIQLIRQIIEAGDFEQGSGSKSQRDPKEQYFEKIRGAVDIQRGMKVAIDTGNGVAGLFTADVLRSLGCEVTELFGNFPNHLPNPENEEYLEDLKATMAKGGLDAGFGYDGDGDRIGLIDETGAYRAADYIIILLARDYLSRHPGDRVLIDVKASKIVLDDIEAHGGVPFMWKTGHSLVKQKMIEEGIMLGGELSGHMFVFEDFFPFDDALYTSARLLHYLSRSDKTISEHLAGLPKLYSTPLILVPTPDDAKFGVIKQITEHFKELYPVNDVDGARVTFDDGWAIVRASNTTPNLTVRFEASTEEALERIEAEVYGVLGKFPEVDLEHREEH